MKKLVLLACLVFLFTSFAPRKLIWVAIGDSITYLNDHPDETGNRITQGYQARICRKLPRIQAVNQGHNGWTAGRIARQIDSLGLIKADVYTVFLGTNDWWQGRPVGQLADYQNHTGNATLYGSFRIIIDKLRSMNPSARIVLITPMQRTDFVYINNPANNAYGSYQDKNGQSLEQFARAIAAIGKREGFPVVDLYHQKRLSIPRLVRFKRLRDPRTGGYRDYPYPEYIGVGFDPKTDPYPYPLESIGMTYDGLHPSDKGYELISRLLIKHVR